MKKYIKSLMFAVSVLLLVNPTKVFALEGNVSEYEQKLNVDTTKEWTIKFNMPLNPDTINSKNIKVTNKSGKDVPVIVSPGKTNDTVIVSPQVSGYIPTGTKTESDTTDRHLSEYYLNVGTEVQSYKGKNLKEPIKMKFTITNKYSNGTSYKGLPQVLDCSFDYTPLLPSQKQGFNLTTTNDENARYRVFVHKYAYGYDGYEELTNGYTSAVNGKITSVKTLPAGENGQKYKVIIYAKRANSTGEHKDSNTDYDNYYVDYFRCVNKIDTEKIVKVNYDKTLEEAVNMENSFDESKTDEGYCSWAGASKNQIRYYMNPENFMDSYGKYQFLKLSYIDGMSKDKLNDFLKGKGILENKAESFLKAAKENNINPIYLVSHALLETGNGTSNLAKGIMVDKVGTTPVLLPKTAYNMFGIRAYDSDADRCGSEFAYSQGWFTPEAAIEGGAKWISQSYINNPNYKQDTLYKMKWNPENFTVHQYATDISWGYNQINSLKKQFQAMEGLLDKSNGVNLTYEVPVFKK